MKGLPLSLRDRRALALGSVTMLSLVAVGRGLPLVRAWTASERTRAAVAVATLARAERLVTDDPAVRRALARRAASSGAADSMLLRAETRAGAGAALAERVADAAARGGVVLGTVTPTTDSTRETGITRVRVRASLTGDITELTGFLAALEGGSPRAVVRALSITQPDPGAPDTQMEVLQVELTVEALAHVRAVGGSR